MWKEAVMAYLKYLETIFQERPQKTIKTSLSRASLYAEICSLDHQNMEHKDYNIL
jgi:hypothetical protein